ncbi:hypothetical protein PHYSODRAFT_511012, partial [Phytophthora sojae]
MNQNLICCTVSGGRTVFAEAWKALRRAWWTSRPPRGRGNLDNRYRYVRPGRNPDGVEGDDYVLGEVALVEHYNMIVAGGEIDSGNITIDEPMDGDRTFKQELLLRAQMSADKIVRANVAFAPADEDWMLRKTYREVGAAFLVGIITRYEMKHEKIADGVKVP